MGEVDQAFIQDVEHRPNPTTTEDEGIPVIDLSILSSPEICSDSREFKALVAEIGDACKNWGFFQIIEGYVINHGVPSETRCKVELASREFFALPIEEKVKVKRDEVNTYGYYDTERTKNVRDWKEGFDFTVENPAFVPVSPEPEDEELKELNSQWPDYPPEMREVCEEYVKEMKKLSNRLMELISLSLGLPGKRLNAFFKGETSFVRLNHYPPCPVPGLALGVGRHKDAGALTILAQDDVGGLQVKRKTDGEWVFVKPTPDAFIINVGDCIQVWSNDAYESVEHRVTVNSERERFSIPFFLNPAHSTWVEPLKELVSEENPAKYKAYNWGKFFASRKSSNFNKFGVVQIYHFKITNGSEE